MIALTIVLGLAAVAFAVLAVRSRHPRQAAGALSAMSVTGALLLVQLGAVHAACALAIVGGALVPLVRATGSRRQSSRRGIGERRWLAAVVAGLLAMAVALPALVDSEPVETRAVAWTGDSLLALLVVGACLPLATLVSGSSTSERRRGSVDRRASR